MRAILVTLCLLMTALAFAPEATARPCVLDQGSNPNVCSTGGSSGDTDYRCVQIYTGTMPNLVPFLCVYVNDSNNDVYLCNSSGILLQPGCYPDL